MRDRDEECRNDDFRVQMDAAWVELLEVMTLINRRIDQIVRLGGNPPADLIRDAAEYKKKYRRYCTECALLGIKPKKSP